MGTQNEFESATVNVLSAFESFEFHCLLLLKYILQ